jgi:hypothetical protein
MVDLILAGAIGGAFAAGFWAGQKYRTWAAMKAAIKAKFKSTLD